MNWGSYVTDGEKLLCVFWFELQPDEDETEASELSRELVEV
jgi:hypothetical protein